jgi:MraZ protein
MELLGSFIHKFDTKGRLVLPSCFREELGSRVVAAIVDAHCISIYSEKNWEITAARLKDASTASAKGSVIQRRILANSHKLEIDSMGRILIPENLRSKAKILQDVSVNGKGNKLEIWDLAHWNEFMSETDPLLDEIAELVPGL